MKTSIMYVFILLLLCLQGFGANKNTTGLGFHSNDLPIGQRTSYDVFSGYRHMHGGRITVSFDMSVMDARRFGHVMTLQCQSGEEFNLIMVNFRDRQKIYLDLNEISSGVKLSTVLDGDASQAGIWHKVVISLDFGKGSVALSTDGNRDSLKYDLAFGANDIKCVFGRSEHYNDVPRMAIRDLRFDCDGKQLFFPLNENSGEEVHDSRGRSVGVVENPEWMINRHFYWTPRADLWTKTFTLVAHDPVRHRIVMYSADTIYTYDMAPRAELDKRANSFADKFEINNSGGLFYNVPADEMIVYNTLPQPGSRSSLARYDHDSSRYEPLDLAIASSKLHHHNMFTDSRGEALYMFGGYGNYTYSGTFYKLVRGTNAWVPERFTGDSIPPRFFASISAGQKETPGIYYLFGGIGNYTGRQEDGVKHFYDLYRIDADNRTVEKIFDSASPEEDFVPADNIVMALEEKCFYAFGYDHNIPVTRGCLYRISMDGKSIHKVSDWLDIVSEKIESKEFLFYDRHYGEIFCVIAEFVPGRGMHISIHSLSYPPQAIHTGVQAAAVCIWIYIMALAALAAIGVAIVFKKPVKKAVVSASDKPDADYDLKASDADDSRTANTIFLMGDFYVSDRKGRDVTHRFGSKIRQLFILILLNSDKGISSDEISAIIWPDNDNPKNIRGVTIKSLRDILSDMDGIELVTQNYKWIINIDSRLCHCDYLAIMSLSPKQLMQCVDDREAAVKQLGLFMRGQFLHSSRYNWLDPFRFLVEEHIGALLSPLLEEAFVRRNYPLAMKVANCLLKVDPFNEEVLKVELKAMRLMGRHEQARLRLNEFAEEYFKAYGKELPRREFV